MVHEEYFVLYLKLPRALDEEQIMKSDYYGTQILKNVPFIDFFVCKINYEGALQIYVDFIFHLK